MFQNFNIRKSFSKLRVFNAFIIQKRSYTLPENILFKCPRKEFAKNINHFNCEASKDNFVPGIVYREKIWALYSEIREDYDFTELDLRSMLKLIPYTSVEEELKLKRVQEIIDRMIDHGYNPGGDGLIALINAHASSPNAMDKIEGLLYSWKHSPPQTKRVYNILLRVYGRIHGAEVAEKWFDSLIGTMIYTESGIKSQSLRPLIKDGGIYTQLIKMYCQEGNLQMAIKKFDEMSKKFDQSNKEGALGKIVNLLVKEGKYREALAWYTTSKLCYMYFDETGYFKVFKTILFYAFSKNVFITATDFINMLGEIEPYWKLEENELSEIKLTDTDLNCLLSDLNVEKSVEDQEKKSVWYYSKDNCLDTEKPVELDVDLEDSDGPKDTEINKPCLVKEISDIFKNQKFGNNSEIDWNAMPQEYDKEFWKASPHDMMKIALSDMLKKFQPTVLTFNSLIHTYFKVGAFDECVKIFEYTKTRLDISYDTGTISVMAKVYHKLGQTGKAIAMARLDKSEILEGDLISVGTQFNVMLSSGRYDELEELFKEMDDIRDLGSRNLTYALRMYIKENKMDEAKRLFERIITTQMEEGKLSAIPFNILIHKYAALGDFYSFNELITRIGEVGLTMDEDTYVHIMKAYIRWNDPETAVKYYRKMIAQGVEQTEYSCNAMIEVFTKMNNETGVIDMIKTMIVKGIVPTDMTLSLIVRYYVNLGKIKEAHQIQDLFVKAFPHLSSSMDWHNVIINYYTKQENRAGVLKELHRATVVYKSIPDITTYTCMVKVYSLTDIEAARKIFDLALEKCVHNLNGDIFAVMMEAYYDLGKYDLAMAIYVRMNAFDVVPDQKILKILSRLNATGATN